MPVCAAAKGRVRPSLRNGCGLDRRRVFITLISQGRDHPLPKPSEEKGFMIAAFCSDGILHNKGRLKNLILKWTNRSMILILRFEKKWGAEQSVK